MWIYAGIKKVYKNTQECQIKKLMEGESLCHNKMGQLALKNARKDF
jgi:hypothetical protein